MVLKADARRIWNSAAVMGMPDGNRMLSAEVKEELEDGIEDGKSATVCTINRTTYFVEVATRKW